MTGRAGFNFLVPQLTASSSAFMAAYGDYVLGWVSPPPIPPCELRGRRSCLVFFPVGIVQHLAHGRLSKAE